MRPGCSSVLVLLDAPLGPGVHVANFGKERPTLEDEIRLGLRMNLARRQLGIREDPLVATR